jgi:hypothetical protein
VVGWPSGTHSNNECHSFDPILTPSGLSSLSTTAPCGRTTMSWWVTAINMMEPSCSMRLNGAFFSRFVHHVIH